MQRIAVLVPVIVWLLLPPGICICQVPYAWSNMLWGTDSAPPPEPRDQHPTWCTHDKMEAGQPEEPLALTLAADLAGACLPNLNVPLPTLDAHSLQPRFAVWTFLDRAAPFSVPLFLDLLTLRP